jgi:hypothetical protein
MKRRIFFGSFLILTSLCSMAGACPMCRDAAVVGSGGGGGPPVALFNTSVLGILGAFLLVAGLLVAKIAGAVRLVNRSSVEQNGTERNSGFVSQSG